MELHLNNDLFEKAFDTMPLGLFVVDDRKKILAWNNWMYKETSISAEVAFGKTLDQLYPDLASPRYDWALDQVLTYGSPQILSQILNQYLLPIAIENPAHQQLDRMQQHVELLPIKADDKRYALVVIQDVTHTVHQKQTLMEMGHKLEQETYHDELTKIYNRRFLWEWLAIGIEQAKREGSQIACLLYDIDHFKRVNDEFGHEMGDKLLLEFVRIVQKTLRAADIFTRYGGEEFVTLMPNITDDVSNEQYYRVQKLLKDSNALSKQLGDITCSAGLAIWQASDPISAKELIDRADQALYQAKQSGRNRICVFDKTS